MVEPKMVEEVQAPEHHRWRWCSSPRTQLQKAAFQMPP